MGDDMDAFGKDVKRLLGRLKKVDASLKKTSSNPKAAKRKQDLAPFLTEDAIQRRQKPAADLDRQALGKIINDSGLPW